MPAGIPVAGKSTWCSDTLIACPVRYALCLTEAQFHAKLKDAGIPPARWSEFIGQDELAVTHWHGRTVLVCLGSTKGQTREQIYALLTHEAVHVWQRIRDIWGEDAPSQELEAYAIQGIAQELMESYKRQVG